MTKLIISELSKKSGTKKGDIMKIAAVSDIHARDDGSDKALLEGIRERVEEIAPDIFVIAGDVSEKLELLSGNLALLKVDGVKNLYVAGNHDIWFEHEKGFSSLDKYSKLIRDVCNDIGFTYLPDNPYTKDGIAFVGSIGWYDYSFRRLDLPITREEYEAKQYRSAVWRDFYNIDWSFSDEEAVELFNSKLKYDLETLPDDVDSVIYVSHHLPFKELTLYRNYLPWDFFSAYMGAESTGEIILADDRSALTISGHSHIRRKINKGRLTAMTVPIGYGRPENSDFTDLVHDAVAVIELIENEVRVEHFVEGDICADLPYIF